MFRGPMTVHAADSVAVFLFQSQKWTIAHSIVASPKLAGTSIGVTRHVTDAQVFTNGEAMWNCNVQILAVTPQHVAS